MGMVPDLAAHLVDAAMREEEDGTHSPGGNAQPLPTDLVLVRLGRLDLVLQILDCRNRLERFSIIGRWVVVSDATSRGLQFSHLFF